MILYFCEVCNFSSNLKANFNRHLKTNKHKKQEKAYGLENDKKNKKGIKNVINRPQTTPIMQNLGSGVMKKTINNVCLTYKEIGVANFMCFHCEKEFTSKSHMTRHLRNSCKKIPKNGQNLQKNGQNLQKNGQNLPKKRPALIPPKKNCVENSENLEKNKKNSNSEKMIIQLLEHQRKIFNEERKELYKHINKLLNKVGNTTITNTTTSNTNIQLNSYGSEDLSHISETFKTEMLKIPYGAIPKMIEAVHFNDKRPENKNIVLSNKRDNKLKIFSGNKWIYKNKDDTLNNLINGKYFILDNHYETICDKLKIINYEDFREKFDLNDKDILNKLKIDSELVLLNNR